jgi:hypothetical protein
VQEKILFNHGDLVLHPWNDEPTPVLEIIHVKLDTEQGQRYERFVLVNGFMDKESHFVKC